MIPTWAEHRRPFFLSKPSPPPPPKEKKRFKKSYEKEKKRKRKRKKDFQWIPRLCAYIYYT